MSGAHAFLAPSSAAGWRRCPSYAVMVAMFPQADTDATREGTASHWVAERIISRHKEPTAGTVAPNGVFLSQEMIEGAKVYANDVLATVKHYEQSEKSLTLVVEAPVKVPRIHAEHCYGTPDAYLYIPGKKRLIVWDYKFGHKEVEVVENDQLIVYAAGILDSVQVSDLEAVVEFRVVQPRCFTAEGPIRKWAFAAHEMRGHVNQLQDAATRALQPNPPTLSGSHCEFCPGRHACQTARRAAMASVDYAGVSMIEPVTPEAVSFELDLLERAKEAIDARLTAMRAQAEQFLRSNKSVPGYGLQDTKGRRRWKPEYTLDMLKSLGAMYNLSIVKEEPITPTQAKAAGIDDAVIAAYSEVPSNGVKLVKQDPNRIIRILGEKHHG